MSLERYKEAINLIFSKKYKDAMIILAELLTTREPYEKIHFFLAICYLNLNYFEDAVKEFELSLDENLSINEKINVLLILGFLYSNKLNDNKKAISYLNSCLKYDEKNIKTLSCLGFCYFELKDYKKAIEYFKAGLEIEPDNANLKNSLGYTIVESGGDLTEALSYINNALKTNPKNPAFLDSYAWANFKANRLAIAFEKIVEAKTLDPENKIINEHYKIISEKIK